MDAFMSWNFHFCFKYKNGYEEIITHIKKYNVQNSIVSVSDIPYRFQNETKNEVIMHI